MGLAFAKSKASTFHGQQAPALDSEAENLKQWWLPEQRRVSSSAVGLCQIHHPVA